MSNAPSTWRGNGADYVVGSTEPQGVVTWAGSDDLSNPSWTYNPAGAAATQGAGASFHDATGSTQYPIGTILDFGVTRTIAGLQISFAAGFGAYGGAYGSIDGTNWTKLLDIPQAPSGNIAATLGTPACCRYLLYWLNSILPGFGPSSDITIWNVAAFAPGGVQIFPAVAGVPTAPVTLSATLTANHTAVAMWDNTVLLTWSTAGATSTSIDQGIGAVAPTGSIIVRPNSTTTYTLTASTCAGTVISSVTVVVVPRRDVYIFSSGILVIGDGSEIAVLQDIYVVPIRANRRTLYECHQVSRFPVDVALFGGGASMVARYAGINHDALQTILGSTESGTNPVVETIGGVLSRTSFKAILTTQDSTGAQQVWTFNNVKVPELAMPADAKDFTMPKFSMLAYKDNAGVIGTISVPW